MTGRSTDIVFLLGAGASVDAGILASAAMIDAIEDLLRKNEEWKPFLPLYHHVKSAIHYAAGLKGFFGRDVQFNIETLVNALYELERNEEHPLYPFIASWNSRFAALAGERFSEVEKFRRQILRQLKRWMCPEDPTKADYYGGLLTLQRELNYPLRLFSLNYDLCVERLSSKDFQVEAGFEASGPRYFWDWERFEHADSAPPSLPQAFLYKIHGSINWKRDASGNLICVEQIENVESDRMEVIFGRDFKLEAADPYLFYAYEFRRFTLSCKLMVIIGYGFGDSHINKMIVQALRDDMNRRLLVVARCESENKCKAKREEISKRLGVAADQILVEKGSAKAFFQNAELAKKLLAYIPAPADSPF